MEKQLLPFREQQAKYKANLRYFGPESKGLTLVLMGPCLKGTRTKFGTHLASKRIMVFREPNACNGGKIHESIMRLQKTGPGKEERTKRKICMRKCQRISAEEMTG